MPCQKKLSQKFLSRAVMFFVWLLFALPLSVTAVDAPTGLEERIVNNLGCPWNFDETLKILLLEPQIEAGHSIELKSSSIEQKKLEETLATGSIKSLSGNQIFEIHSHLKILSSEKAAAVRKEFARFQNKKENSRMNPTQLLEAYLSQGEDFTPALVSFSLALGRLEMSFTEAGGSCQANPRLNEIWSDMKKVETHVLLFSAPTFPDLKIFDELSSPTVLSDDSFLSTSPASWSKDAYASSPLLKGAWNVMGTLYQSCSVHEQYLIDAKVFVQGIEITGKHPGGIGDKRELVFKGGLPVPEFYDSHPYLKTFDEEYRRIGRARGCFDWTRNAPIYDFGGKPAWTDNKLDLFTNHGSGTSVLGIDCSGFVIAAALTSGQRLIKDQANDLNKFTENFGSGAFKSPKANGLSCLSPFPMEHSTALQNFLRPGDIMAGHGHVIIVESVSSDPFGLKRLHSLKDCRAGRFDTKTFGLSIIHSSANNNGIGLARHDLKGFDRETYNAAFQELAVKACRAYFDPEFKSSSNLSVGISFVRADPSPSCREPRFEMALESCVDQCLFKNF